MASNRDPRRGGSGRHPSSGSARPGSGGAGQPHREPSEGRPTHSRLSLRELGPGRFELVHPACVERLWDDYLEALEAWRQGEPEEARDMLRFALEGCGDHLWIHCALGQIGLELDKDPALAQGHFGYAFDLAERAIPRGFAGILPPDIRGNAPLYQAIDGLIRCATAAGRSAEVSELSRLRVKYAGR